MRIKIFCGVLLLLMLNVVVLYAQVDTTTVGVPMCGDITSDVDNHCPLDTWVIVLAVVVTAFAAIRLYRKQPRLNSRN